MNVLSSLLNFIGGKISNFDSRITTLGNNLTTLSSTVSTISGRVGTATLNTTAQTAMAAINELLTRITNLSSSLSTTNSNVTAVSNRATNLETKTGGFVGTKQYTVDSSGGKTYVPLHAQSTYIVVTNAYSTSNALRGMYIVGATTSSVLGIQEVLAASSVELVDSGTIGGTSGVLRITNNGSVTLRVTVITTTGTAV